jgi:hypothetical protein
MNLTFDAGDKRYKLSFPCIAKLRPLIGVLANGLVYSLYCANRVDVPEQSFNRSIVLTPCNEDLNLEMRVYGAIHETLV